MKIKEQISKIKKSGFLSYFTANVVYSLSTFLINLSLPKVLAPQCFNEFIYLFQMVFFITTIAQFGMVVGLYKFLNEFRTKTYNIYYVLILCINICLIILGLFNGNFVSSLLKLGELSFTENLMFYISIIISGIYCFNKGKNVAEKAYKYMLRISLTVFITRILLIIYLHFVPTTSISALFTLLFVVPFFQDIKDYIVNSIKYISFKSIDTHLCKTFTTYCSKAWIIGVLFMISDKYFLISTKDINAEFTIALSFSAGFMGIISLFNNSFSNFFLSRLSSKDPISLFRYIVRLKKAALPYLALLLIICTVFSAFVLLIYPSLGKITPVITFIVLFRAGFIAYLGQMSLLSKVLDLLNLEISLNICRIAVVFFLCLLITPEHMLLWYVIIMFIIPFPEFVIALVANHKVKTLVAKL